MKSFLKVLVTIAIAGIIGTGCSSHSSTPYYGGQTTANKSNTKGLWVHRIAQSISGKANAFDVESEDRERHQRCVFFALEELNLGEKCVWNGPETGDRGTVRVTAIYPMASGMCHVFFTHLQTYGGGIKNWQDTACYKSSKENWVFMSEY